jgi:prepilin signal peptidase PulO-like enzyme (type II secretory pathway)
MQGIPDIAGILFSGVVGLLLGSFATMVSYRLPRGEDMVFKRSRCVVCEHPLGVRDLLPCLSWVIQKGKCHYCRATIHYRYPVIEMLMGALCIACYFTAGWSWPLPILYLTVLCLVVISVIDIEYRIMPDNVQLLLAVLAILYRYMGVTTWVEILQGAALGLGVGLMLRYGYYYLRRREGLGLGDVKFFAVAGIFLSPFAFVLFLFYSGIIGTVLGVGWGFFKKEKLFPFAPALCAALLICTLAPYWTVDYIYYELAQAIEFFVN